MMFIINHIKSIILKLSFVILFFFIVVNSAISTGADSLFLSDELMNIELRSDFSAIENDREDKPEYHQGELIYHTPGGETVKLSVRVMARGNFRRDPSNCSFPPLFVNFKKNEVNNTLFENQTRLKLVTPCQDDEDVIEEYLIYKMYNQVTDLSKKVRLAKILYFDTALDRQVFERFSFFIEDKDHAAERNNAIEKDRFFTPFDLERENVKKMSVFQYMIGNKDWYITSRKNIVVVQPNDTTLAPYAIPYDFDFAGFIDADYTKPKGVPDSRLVERRIYRGICYSEGEFKEVFEFYRNLRPVFESIIKNQNSLPDYNKRKLIGYLSEFYSIIRSRDMIRQEFLENCQTKKDYNIPDA